MRHIETMMKNGKPYVVVLKQHYDAMLQQIEDSADEAALAHAIARGEEGFPLAVWDAIVAGEHPVRVFRTYRGLTQQQLAERAGVARPMLSDIENSKKSGSIATMKSIAAALAVPLEELV